jgi:hypothetical protein
VNPLKYRRGLLPALLFLSFALPGTLRAQAGATPASRVMAETEDLIYNVRYTFVDLGQVRIRNYGREKKVSFHAYETRANIDSYKSIPFVDLHAIFLSTIDSAVYSRAFTGKVKQDDSWDYARYHFEYDRERVLIEKGNRDTVVSQWDTLNVKGAQQDGLSLFYFAREHLYAGRTLHAPAIVAEKPVNAYINFVNKHDEVEIDAIEYPVDVVYFDGNLDFTGIFGLNGYFEGWFSNDEARIPILAKMKVLIGSVTIELMSWKRQGWTPPRGRG